MHFWGLFSFFLGVFNTHSFGKFDPYGGTAPLTKNKHVFYLKIINTFSKSNMHLIVNSRFKEFKNGFEILVELVVFKLRIKTVKMLFESITQEPLPKF